MDYMGRNIKKFMGGGVKVLPLIAIFQRQRQILKRKRQKRWLNYFLN